MDLSLGLNIERDYYKCETRSLGAMVREHKIQFRIPLNQRPWSWKQEDLIRLWRDGLSTREVLDSVEVLP